MKNHFQDPGMIVLPLCVSMKLLWSNTTGSVSLAQRSWQLSHLFVIAKLLWTLSRSICGHLLKTPDFPEPFVVIADASEVELGAILCQELENIGSLVFPINVSCCCCCYYYVSSEVLPGGRRYGITERARLAVEMGSRSRMILSRGNEFTFMTDHYPLLELNRMKDKSSRIT